MTSDCKPCPFCGGNDLATEFVPPIEGERDYPLFAIVCWECNAQSGYYRTSDEAEANWNMRVSEG